MDFIFQNVLNALQWGSFYALIALGYTLVYGVLRLINFAHGDIFMVGAYISFFVAGANTTLPIPIFSSIRRGITPEVNAIGTMVLAESLILLMTAQFLLRARSNRALDKGG